MDRKSLDEIMYCVDTGRALSPACIRSAAVSLMETPLDEMIDKSNDGRYYWAEQAKGFTSPVREGKTYWDAAGGMLKKKALHEKMSTGFFLCHSFLRNYCSDSVKSWMKLGAEDVMREAGFDTEYEKWFQEDAVLWEKRNGKVPTVENVVEYIEHIVWDDNLKVQPYMEIPDDYAPVGLKYAFWRNAETYGMDPNNIRDFVFSKEKNIRLSCVWAWFLMVEAPGRIYYNVKYEE